MSAHILVLLVLIHGTITRAAGVRLDEAVRVLSLKHYDEALTLLEPIIKTEPRNARAWTTKGLALAGMGRVEESLNSFRQALEVSPNYLPALKAAAQSEYNLGNPHSRVLLERIVSLTPEDQTAHAMLGELAFEKGDCGAATTNYEKSREAIASNLPALWQFGQCLVSLQRPRPAVEVFRQVMALEPNSPAARYNLGLTQYLSKQYGEAAATLEVLAADPKPDAEVLNLLADALEADRKTGEAVATLRKAIEIYPRDVRNYLGLAALCMDHSSFDLGIEITEVGLKNIPDSAALYAMRGILHAQKRQPEIAEADFEKADQLDPKQNFGVVGLGINFLQRDKPGESIRVLRSRLATTPNDYSLNYLLAEALIRKGLSPAQPEFEEARSALLRAIKTKPDYALAHAQLGKLCLMSGDAHSALRECELAVKLAPNDRMAVYTLVRAMHAAGRGESGIQPLLRRLEEIDMSQLRDEADKQRVHLVKVAPLQRF